jgi:hypothetical protein
VSKPVAEIAYSGDVEVRQYRRGTYLGRDHLEALIERALGAHYSFGEGWRGFGVVSITLYDEPPADLPADLRERSVRYPAGG